MAGPAFFASGMNVAKNEDWLVGFQLLEENESPVDLTGSSLQLMIRKHETDHESLVMVQTPNNGIEIYDPIFGKFLIWITIAKLSRLFPGEYVADLLHTRPDGIVQRLWDATPVVVSEGATR